MKKFIDESWLVLLLGAVFAALLAAAQTSFSARIEQNQTAALNKAISEVVPGTKKAEPLRVEDYDRDVFRCTDDAGQVVGWAIDTVGMGFADKIRLVIGLSVDAQQITGLKVIENIETPGWATRSPARARTRGRSSSAA